MRIIGMVALVAVVGFVAPTPGRHFQIKEDRKSQDDRNHVPIQADHGAFRPQDGFRYQARSGFHDG